MSSTRQRVAALDLGTHSFHMVIAALDPGRGTFRVLHREKETVRLGAGGHAFLTEEAMSRGIAALRRFRRMADAAGAPIRAIATSAVREAVNRDEFLERAFARTGIRIKIASGAEEARLTWLGVQQALPASRSQTLLLDVGGGSTEFLLARGRRILYTNSLKIGAVRVSERYFPGGRVDGDSVKKCREFLRGTLDPVLRELRKLGFARAAGSSGTLLTLAVLSQLQQGVEIPERLSGIRFTRPDLKESLAALVKARTSAERSRIDGLDPRRADVIVGGALIVDEVFRGLSIPGITVSSMALREGILADELQRRATTSRRSPAEDSRRASVGQLAKTYHTDLAHGRHVAHLALRIFDQTAKLHRLGESEREYLEAAAVLHEVGFFVSHSAHHRHSYYLIRNSDLLGFTENEKEIIACVARYHRKGPPRPRHEGFRGLGPDEQAAVRGLSAILRIADGLDRSHRGAVRDVKCTLTRARMSVRVRRSRPVRLDLEMWGASRKADMFEEVFARKVEFQQSK